ncbi:MAG: ADOP family duplicated permease [Bryobacteraceae bacterium]
MNFHDFLLRAEAILRRRKVEEELDEELQSHLELQTRKHLDAGLSIEEAKRQARIDFGVVELAKDNCRDERRVNVVDDLFQDLRYAFRGFRRDPVLAFVAMLTLAICIGANTTVFSLVNTIILRPLPYPDSNRLYWLSEWMGRNQNDFGGIGADYYSLRENNRVFEAVAAYDPVTVNWIGMEKPEQLDAAQVTPSFFKVFGTPPLAGRYLASDEQGAKAPAVIVLSYSFWRSRMASDPHIVGKTITLDGLPTTVIGVMPQGFDYPKGTRIWKPLPMDEPAERPRLVTRPMRLVSMVARLTPGVSGQQLDTDLNRLTTMIYREYPNEFKAAKFLDGMKILATPLQRRIAGDLRPALLILSGVVGLVLLIACVNLANLLLARATARQRELAVRMALGSGHARIVKQVLTESIALAAPGGLAGIFIAFSAVAILNTWKPLVLQNYPLLSLDVPTLLFTIGLTLLTGLVFGMAPAMAAAGVSIQEALKSAGHAQTSERRAVRLRHLLMITELAVSLILLIGAGLLGRSFLKLAHVELGFSPANLLTLRFNLTGSRYATAEGQARFYDDVLDSVKQLPQVRLAAVSTDLPLTGERPYSGASFQVTGRAPLSIAQQPQAAISVVSRDFFKALGIPLRNGRVFDARDTSRSPDNIVVNESFAKKIFPRENPLGQRIFIGPNRPVRWTIVGVVAGIRGGELGAESEPLIYRCTCQGGDPFLSRLGLLVRTTTEPSKLVRLIESQIYKVDRNEPVFDVKTMGDRLTDSLAPQRFHLLLIGIFAAIAVLLAAVGIYGVMSYLVSQRTRELGIRIALGARMEHVLGLVLGESFIWSLAAVVAGVAGAWALTRYLASMLYGVTALDPITFTMMPLLLAAVAITASLIPALRAVRIDPNTALREE